MLRLTLRGLFVRRARAALTGLSVVLGVSLISGTLIFIDATHRAVHQTFTNAARGADAVISGRQPTDTPNSQPPSIDEALLPRLRSLSGVQRAEGQISDLAAIVRPDGSIVQRNGARARAVSYLGPPFQQLQLVAGQAPQARHDVVLDQGSARAEHLAIGSRIRIATEQPQQRFRITGLVRFGNVEQPGVSLLAFSLPEAQALFLKQHRFDAIAVTGNPGVTPRQLARQIAPLLGDQFVARTSAEQVQLDSRRLEDSLAFIEQALLALGAIAVAVGAFVIFNTFSITLAQRTAELGLLSALGASRARILRAVLTEALLIGALASGAAIGIGFAVAAGIGELFGLLGQGLPSRTAELSARTILISLGAGLSVCAAAALAPAWRAARQPPINALRAGARRPPRPTARRSAGVIGIAGLGACTYALAWGPSPAAAIGGAVALVLSGAVLAPRLARCAASVLGRPLERYTSLAGRIARENAMRSSAAAATSAAAVAIGLGLVVFVASFAGETRNAIRVAVARSFAGDLAITPASGAPPIPQAAAAAMFRVPGVQTVSTLKRSDSTVSGAGSVPANGFDTQTLAAVYHFDWVAGDDSVLGLLGPTGVIVERDLARRAHLQVGSHFEMTSPSGKRLTLTVRGIYRDRSLLAGYATSLPTFNGIFHEQRARRILVKLAPGANLRAAQRAANLALAAFPEARARSERELADQEAASLDNAALLLYALLGLSVIVSLLGLTSTLALQVHERRREIGVLRAVGASRRVVRRMVRYESVITALMGGAAGIALGVLAAALTTASLSSAADLHLALPWGTLAAALAAALALGVLAAAGPARRAARTDVLAAIAYE
ncbi:MAG: FtsX-like permease family protein [Solirubrobacteraceae bacterium]